MLVFSNYENFASADINNLQTKLNNYSVSMESLIDSIDASFDANIYQSSVDQVTTYNDDLIDLSMVNNLNILSSFNNLSDLDSSMNIIKDKIDIYDNKKKDLDKQLGHYNSVISRLKDGKVTRNYYLMLIWIIILFVVGYASFFSEIEEKNDINIISKIILFLLLLFVAYFIFNNIYLYFSGYQINYSPLK